MENYEARTETVESRLSAILNVVYRVESRGIRVEHRTLGEIMYIEHLAHEREQIAWACSAQSKELLPDSVKKKKPGTAKAAVQSVVTSLVNRGDY